MSKVTLRADQLIKLTSEKLNLPEDLVNHVVKSFFLDSLRHYLYRPYEAKGHIDLAPYFQIRISVPKLRYILSYKTYGRRLMIVCSQLFKYLKKNGKRQTGYEDQHERLVDAALKRTAERERELPKDGKRYERDTLYLRQHFPGEIDEIQRKYFDSESEISEPETKV